MHARNSKLVTIPLAVAVALTLGAQDHWWYAAGLIAVVLLSLLVQTLRNSRLSTSFGLRHAPGWANAYYVGLAALATLGAGALAAVSIVQGFNEGAAGEFVWAFFELVAAGLFASIFWGALQTAQRDGRSRGSQGP